MISATHLCSRIWTQFAFYRNFFTFSTSLSTDFHNVYSVTSSATNHRFGNKDHLAVGQNSNSGECYGIPLCQSRQSAPFTTEVKALISPDFLEWNLINNPIDGICSPLFIIWDIHVGLSTWFFLKVHAQYLPKWVSLLTLHNEAVGNRVVCSSFGDSCTLPLPSSWLDLANIPQIVLRTSA